MGEVGGGGEGGREGDRKGERSRGAVLIKLITAVSSGYCRQQYQTHHS